MSLSGKIVYQIADRFVVQWPLLKDKYPRAKYMGRLIWTKLYLIYYIFDVLFNK